MHTNRISILSRKAICAIACAIAISGVAAVDRIWQKQPLFVRERIEAVQEWSKDIPVSVGNWVSVESEVPPAAVRLLRPNAIFARQYTNLTTLETASIIFVHVTDARDLVGHYPPSCYPAQGWQETSRTSHRTTLQHLSLAGTEYLFERRLSDEEQRITVYSWLASPETGFTADMNAIVRSANSIAESRAGAAHLQIVFTGETSTERRTEIVDELLKPLTPLLIAAIDRPHAPGTE